MREQLETEYKDRENTWGHKERDCLRAYLSVRTEMVLKHSERLNIKFTEDEIEQLARNTRGMIETEIRKCVDEYLKTGKLPTPMSHPTNTCDPYTGNWTERLMDPHILADILSQKGFEVSILNGYYGLREMFMMRLIAKILNMAIYASKKQGVRIAPFYTIYGRRS
jgi:hypothetical protein